MCNSETIHEIPRKITNDFFVFVRVVSWTFVLPNQLSNNRQPSQSNSTHGPSQSDSTHRTICDSQWIPALNTGRNHSALATATQSTEPFAGANGFQHSTPAGTTQPLPAGSTAARVSRSVAVERSGSRPAASSRTMASPPMRPMFPRASRRSLLSAICSRLVET
jgi:hypothetical protein